MKCARLHIFLREKQLASLESPKPIMRACDVVLLVLQLSEFLIFISLTMIELDVS
jgi:hypothetical protein